MSTIVRASVTAAALNLPSGAAAPILVDGSDTPITANGLQGYQPMPGDRLLVQQVGTTMEVLQYLSTGTVPGLVTFRQSTAPNPVTTPNGAIWWDTSNGNLPNKLENNVWVPLTMATGAFDSVDVRRTVVERGYTMGSGGTAVLASGITAPTTAPIIDTYYPVAATDAKRGTFQIPVGLTNHATDSTKMVYCSIFFGTQINVMNKSNFLNTGAALQGTWGSQFYAFNGVAQAGADYYLLGQDNNRSVAQYLYRIDGTTGAKTSELAIAGTGISYTAKPGIVSDGTNVGIVWWSATGAPDLWLRWYNSSYVQQGSDIKLISSALGWTGGTPDVGDLVWGDSGSGGGASTLYLAWNKPSDLSSSPGFTVQWTGVTTTAYGSRTLQDFPIAKDASGLKTVVSGMHYDSAQGRMLHFDGTSGVNGGNGAMYVYSKLAATTGGSASFTARYTYYDGDTGNYAGGVGSGTVFVNGTDVSGTASTAHETTYSPTATLTIPMRAWVRVTALQAPDVLNLDTTLVDRANRHGVYVALGGGTMWRQAYTAVGIRLIDSFDTLASSGTPDVHDFTTAQASLGLLRSAATRLDGKPKFLVDGTGTPANMDGLIPPGAMMMWPVATIPTGWLACDGSSQVIATYPDLSAAIRGTYGGVDGTHFNLPDMRDLGPIGVSGTKAVGTTGGSATITLTAAQMDHTHSMNGHTHLAPSHTHGVAIGVATNTTASGASTRVTTVNGGAATGTFQTDAGGSSAQTGASSSASTLGVQIGAPTAINILDPYRALNFIIKT